MESPTNRSWIEKLGLVTTSPSIKGKQSAYELPQSTNVTIPKMDNEPKPKQKATPKVQPAIEQPKVLELSEEQSEPEDLAQSLQQFRDRVKHHIVIAIEHLNNGEIARKSLTTCQLKASESIQEALNELESLTNSYEQRLASLSEEYQKDIESIIQCYKEEKDYFQEVNQKQELELQSTLKHIDHLENQFQAEAKAEPTTNIPTPEPTELEEAQNKIKALEKITTQERELRQNTEIKAKKALSQAKQSEEKRKKTVAKARKVITHLFETPWDSNTKKKESKKINNLFQDEDGFSF